MKQATIITGTVGMDAHVIGTKILSRVLRENGYNVVELGVLTPAEDFIKAAQETAADAILVSSLYGMAELDLADFKSKCVEAGLVEEFFFRAVLQERIAQTLGSPWAGVFFGVLIFGLAHVPGLVLRSGEGGWLEMLSRAVLVLAPAGLVMAVLWMRTRNLWLLAAIHGAGDVIPSLEEIGGLFDLIPAP